MIIFYPIRNVTLQTLKAKKKVTLLKFVW